MKALKIFFYVVVGAVLGGLLLSAIPALLGNASLTKALGLIGCGVGALAGLWYGARRHFA